jgi:RNA-directed DNA polymerase
VEGRDQPRGNLPEEARARTQSRTLLPLNLQRVNEAARRDRKTRFTALLHHVDVWALLRAFRRLKRSASPGVDGQTYAQYEQHVGADLEDLCRRIHTGPYRPQPVRRVFIPKADGGPRPLGVPTLEDELVQSAIAEVLSAIYEVDFLGFSYGFRPGRDPHQALSALHTALMTQCVNWVLDADFRKFFETAS